MTRSYIDVKTVVDRAWLASDHGNYRGWTLQAHCSLSQNTDEYLLGIIGWSPEVKTVHFFYRHMISQKELLHLPPHVVSQFMCEQLEGIYQRIRRAINMWEDNPGVQVMYQLGGVPTLNELLAREEV